MPATISRGNKLIVMFRHNYESLPFSVNELMNDEIDEKEKEAKNSIFQFNGSTLPAATTSNYYNINNGSSNQALATQFDSSVNKSTIHKNDSIPSGSTIANTHTTHDAISDTFTNYYSNNCNNGSSNQPQYFQSVQES